MRPPEVAVPAARAGPDPLRPSGLVTGAPGAEHRVLEFIIPYLLSQDFSPEEFLGSHLWFRGLSQ